MVLSRIEEEILKKISNGKSIKAMAIDLGLTEPTCETYRTRMYKKMRVVNAPHAVAWGFRRKYLV